jgi:hypothetical protein
MLLHFMRAIQTQSISRFPLQALKIVSRKEITPYFINEICSFERPPITDLMLPNLNLLCENAISDVFPSLPIIGSLYKY